MEDVKQLPEIQQTAVAAAAAAEQTALVQALTRPETG